jgi:nucleoside-diphosphate-sugar epimerase
MRTITTSIKVTATVRWTDASGKTWERWGSGPWVTGSPGFAAKGRLAGARQGFSPTPHSRCVPFPDPGTPLQLVHHDDVAAAIALAATTSAPAGAYNIAGDGVISVSDMVSALGGRPVRVPHAAATAASAVVSRLPFVPAALEWLHVGRTSLVMDTSKAKSELG